MKTKKLIFAFLFVISSLTILSQQKYDFASVTYDFNNKIIALSINGKEYMEQKAELPKEARSIHNQNPLFEKIKELQNQGWELMEFKPIGIGMYYYSIAYMRKKQA